MNKKNLKLVRTALANMNVNPVERDQQLRKKMLIDTLGRLKITTASELPPVEFLFDMMDKPCFPRGELVSVTGKAKSGKTYFLSLLMAACTGRDVVGIRRRAPVCAPGTEAPPDMEVPPLRCLWYDTEQSRQSTLEILRERIVPLAAPPGEQGAFAEEMYDIFNTRGVDCDERIELLCQAIGHYRPDMVVLDGICDLVTDINDGTRVKPVVEMLMRTAQEVNCCIVCAIHQNKSSEDRNPRGWMGTELNNKSFEVYGCELLKPQMIFAVEQLMSRRYRMDELFCFVVNDQGMPFRAEMPQIAADSSTTERRSDYPPMNDKYISWVDNRMQVDLRSLFCDLLKGGWLYYTDLQRKGMELLGCKDTGFWNKLFNDAKNQYIVVRTRNNNDKAVWMLPPKTQAPTQADMYDAPPRALG